MSFSRTTRRVGLALAATLTGLVALATPAEATTSVSALGVTTAAYTGTPAMDPGSYEKKVQYWINKRRANHGLRKVWFNQCSDSYAEKWSVYLADNMEFFHQSLTPMLDKCNAYYAGETLARGMISPRQTVRLWMQSEGHRHILMSKYPNRVGIGATVDSEGRWLVAADFIKVS